MINLRKAAERGHSKIGWLDSYHTFSFSSYYDPRFTGFRSLLVINEDRVQPAMGFGTHGHRDMEIISYVLEGALEHKDSMGNGSIIRPGEVQLMRAGTGVRHSEFNHSKIEETHFLQIWLLPDEEGLEPAYEQKIFSDAEKRDRLRLVASPSGDDGSVRIHQDARLFASVLSPGASVKHDFQAKRHGWLQVVRGEVLLFGQSQNSKPENRLEAGDGAAISAESSIELRASSDAEILLFDLA